MKIICHSEPATAGEEYNSIKLYPSPEIRRGQDDKTVL